MTARAQGTPTYSAEQMQDVRRRLRGVEAELDAERAAHAVTREIVDGWRESDADHRKMLDAERARTAELLAALEGVANSLEAEVRRADGSGLHLSALVDHARAALARARGQR